MSSLVSSNVINATSSHTSKGHCAEPECLALCVLSNHYFDQVILVSVRTHFHTEYIIYCFSMHLLKLVDHHYFSIAVWFALIGSEKLFCSAPVKRIISSICWFVTAMHVLYMNRLGCSRVTINLRKVFSALHGRVLLDHILWVRCGTRWNSVSWQTGLSTMLIHRLCP